MEYLNTNIDYGYSMSENLNRKAEQNECEKLGPPSCPGEKEVSMNAGKPHLPN